MILLAILFYSHFPIVLQQPARYPTMLWRYDCIPDLCDLHPYADPAKEWVAGDFNFNGAVEDEDVGWLRVCWSGPSIPLRDVPAAGDWLRCTLCDLDQDRDVDQNDFGLLQANIGRE